MTISPEGSFRFPKTEGKVPRLPLPFCYVCAISIATLSFMFVLGVSDYLGPGAANDPFAVRISNILVGTIIAGFFFWLFTVVAAIVPGTLIYIMARRLTIEHALYYVACGAITGLILTPMGEYVYNRIFLL